jgi:prepilin-type N-terminal cleavage/methylation domain-containing protein
MRVKRKKPKKNISRYFLEQKKGEGTLFPPEFAEGQVPVGRGQKLKSMIFYPSGFSIIELIVVIVILGILGSFTFSFLGNSMESYVRVKNNKTLYDEGRQAMEYMVREIRDADQNAAISLVANTSISFIRINPSSASITYTRTPGGILNRVSGGQTLALAGNVQAFNPTITGTAPQRVVSLELTLNGSGIIIFRTQVYPRN